MDLASVIKDIAEALKQLDATGARFKDFQPGIGPFGEPQLVKRVAVELGHHPQYEGRVQTKRTPDLLIRENWALEVKLVRPFGDNGKPAENWSVNLLHPYSGNTSLLGDCLKLRSLPCQERKGVAVIGYEHDPPQVRLEPLFKSFEVIARDVLQVHLGPRVEARRTELAHPVHQQLIVAGWELL